MIDMTESIAPKSDQQNFDDYLAGPRTVTISEVKTGSAEQPIELHLVEYPGRPYKPSKSMRRVLVGAWGTDASVYAGRRMTLVGDPTVRFGGAVVGGIKISHMSDLSKPLTLFLTASKGKRAPHTVQPLAAPAVSRSQRDTQQQPRASIRPVDPPDGPLTDNQLTAINAALTTDFELTDRAAKLEFLSAKLGREIGSSREMTRHEAGQLLSEWNDSGEPAQLPGSDQ
jgi:hypothetical protein